MSEGPRKADIVIGSLSMFTFLVTSAVMLPRFPGWEVQTVAFVLFAALWWIAAGWMVDLISVYWGAELNYESRTNDRGAIADD